MSSRLYGDPKPCPAGCGRTVRQGHLTCPPCWRRIPRALQSEVYRTLRAWQRDMSDDRWAAYLDAREHALASLT